MRTFPRTTKEYCTTWEARHLAMCYEAFTWAHRVNDVEALKIWAELLDKIQRRTGITIITKREIFLRVETAVLLLTA